jgi:hypothetical protein
VSVVALARNCTLQSARCWTHEIPPKLSVYSQTAAKRFPKRNALALNAWLCAANRHFDFEFRSSVLMTAASHSCQVSARFDDGPCPPVSWNMPSANRHDNLLARRPNCIESAYCFRPIADRPCCQCEKCTNLPRLDYRGCTRATLANGSRRNAVRM